MSNYNAISSGIQKFLNDNNKKNNNCKDKINKIITISKKKITQAAIEKWVLYISQDNFTSNLLNNMEKETNISNKNIIINKYSLIINQNIKQCNNDISSIQALNQFKYFIDSIR